MIIVPYRFLIRNKLVLFQCPYSIQRDGTLSRGVLEEWQSSREENVLVRLLYSSRGILPDGESDW